jgi:hypothetical protein
MIATITPMQPELATNTPAVSDPHCQNTTDIISAIRDRGKNQVVQRDSSSLPLEWPDPNPYQRHLWSRFAHVIFKPSFDYISKTADSWLVVGDRRSEVAVDIQLIIERHGLGIGMLVLHAQQIQSRHIPTRITLDGEERELARPTESRRGERGEHVLWIPIRQFRSDFDRLAALNIAKPQPLWDRARIVTHERDQDPCFYCSCGEINPAEVVVDVEAARQGLSRSYNFGFTFAPFGNPFSAIHFLAWDRSCRPLNMSRTPMAVSDLVKLTHAINSSIRDFFLRADIRDFPVLDGLSNGWAGNTIYHQHFQFFQPEHPTPIGNTEFVKRKPLLQRDDVAIQRLDWPAPIFQISAGDSLNTGLVGNDLAGLWRQLGGARKVPYKNFREGVPIGDDEMVAAHTHNLYAPGRDLGATLYVVLRAVNGLTTVPPPMTG